jgi:hypothetical protein
MSSRSDCATQPPLRSAFSILREMLCSGYCFTATSIKNNSRILSRSLLPGDDPFFNLLYVDQDYIKKFIECHGGRSTDEEFIAAIGIGLKFPLRKG